MKATKTFSVFLVSIIFFVFSIPSVYAIWNYCTFTNPTSSTTPITIIAFNYKPEEILPGTNATLGNNHIALLDNILYEASYGLNATKKPIIHNYLKNVGDVVYCDMNTSGGNLKHVMIDEAESSNQLYFVVTKISNTEYHCFTMSKNELDNATLNTTRITAYKTVMIKENNIWSATTSYKGTALVFKPSSVPRAIDVTTWQISHT